jgi:hypothetical protein
LPSFPKAGFFMALVLSTGVDQALLKTRRLILESSGHKVVTAMDETALLAACKEHFLTWQYWTDSFCQFQTPCLHADKAILPCRENP